MLSLRSTQRVATLWDELADFPAGQTDTALEHLLSGLCRMVDAQSAYWLGAVRLPAPKREDALRGWRPRAIRCLHENPRDDELYRQLLRQLEQGTVDESARARARHAGVVFRAARLKELVSPGWFHSPFYQYAYASRDIRDAVFVAFPAGRDVESHFTFHRIGQVRPFGTRERDLLSYAIRGLKWFNRQVLLSHGLLAARAPLTPTERRVQHLLLTKSSEQEIAQALNLTRATTHKYITDLFRRFGVHGRAGLTALWLGGGAAASSPARGVWP